MECNMDSAHLCHNSDTITDCFGIEFKVIKMQGSGFCLYHSLSHCLTGNDKQFVDIINDCLTVFRNIPELFRLRTNFGSYCDSSLTLDDYASYMQQAIQLVHAGQSVDSHAYGDEGHIAAIALLYDITIFIYSMQNKLWYVFNECSRSGYICLLNLPDHFDVLHGTNGPPTIPHCVHTHGVNRHTFETSVHTWQCLQHTYSFQYVFTFPEQYSGVKILNNPVVADSVICNPNTNIDVEDCRDNPYRCDNAPCNYVAKNVNAVNMHRLRCHYRKHIASGKLDPQVYSPSSQSVHVCKIPGCNFTSFNQQQIAVHTRIYHKSPFVI